MGSRRSHVSGQHLLWTLLTPPVHTAPCSSCPLHQSDLPLGPPSTSVFPLSFLLRL
ncbi:hypothetical protein NP493_2361g00004 [Ridgeia piscesae]|uniref:Uncharacterized protein n=1 Tax=Ridgeia piscesae TaxID=27915 RepID=A0AAD9JH47_RIDPI|nr:hypothetical protein NP493_2361g00004 [Ridgeia piscesae]